MGQKCEGWSGHDVCGAVQGVTSCRVSVSRVYWIPLSSCHSDTQDSRKRPQLDELMGGRPHSSARLLLTLQLCSVSNTGFGGLSTSAAWFSDTDCVHMRLPPLLLRMPLPSHTELCSLQPFGNIKISLLTLPDASTETTGCHQGSLAGDFLLNLSLERTGTPFSVRACA